jgi:hypothetical protein
MLYGMAEQTGKAPHKAGIHSEISDGPHSGLQILNIIIME